ncbi:MAG TPA: sigma 54-interacting transcriptional regulator [Polyangiaceae bacterium]
MAELELPSRYEPIAELGKGGGGEVWAVRDRYSGKHYALKVLAEQASEREMSALVREAVALSGLEGLGLPRVVQFGRLSSGGRAYLIRDLVDGQSLDELVSSGQSERALSALGHAADQLTVLHRAGLLHGDVKPANIIVSVSDRATLVDLGLAAPWLEGGAHAEGLTPRYAAPELLGGGALTVRAEVFALGVTLTEILGSAKPSHDEANRRRKLQLVAARATLHDASGRYPSVDEFASALRNAAGIPAPSAGEADVGLWPVVGIDATSAQLLEQVRELSPSNVLRIGGPPGSGKTALFRRLAWSLGVAGVRLCVIDDAATPSVVSGELAAHPASSGVTILVDAADALEASSVKLLAEARAAGARLVVVGEMQLGGAERSFVVPALDEHAAIDLLKRAVPSLTPTLLQRVFEVSGGRPGELQRLVRLIAHDAIASTADIERAIGALDGAKELPSEPLERAAYFLDRGRFNDAQVALDALGQEHASTRTLITRARLQLGLGEAPLARDLLSSALRDSKPSDAERKLLTLYLARAEVGVGEYQRALALLEELTAEDDPLGAEALSYRGLALSMIGKHEDARAALETALGRAQKIQAPRLETLVLASLGLVLQRADLNEAAHDAYRRALTAAQRAGDAGMLATIQLNLAGLLKIRGDIAGAIEHFEAAVDMGRRSGRKLSARQALLNLANADLYLGRLARARASIQALREQVAQLSPVMRAQLTGLEAELALREGDAERAVELYAECAQAYVALGRGTDAAEARLEGLLAASRRVHPDLRILSSELALSARELGDTAHRPLLLLASARVRKVAGAEGEARTLLDEALVAARGAAQKEWIWRALEARAELEAEGGQQLLARRDREEALAVLEEIAARLPRDLREVYWNDTRRRGLRACVPAALATAATEFLPFNADGRSSARFDGGTLRSPGKSAISELTSTPLEQRLAWILEVNSGLVGEFDVPRLTAKITDYAVQLARAERGYVLLRQVDGSLSVHTSRSRSGDLEHAEFSRSIAESVMTSREAIVALNARGDSRLKSFASVHQLLLESVACLPILAPSGDAIGALYLETRLRPGAGFEREMPTLQAFADQVAIALENARLVNENQQRNDELVLKSSQLEEAQARLHELLEGRTEQLKRARQKLRDARETLYGHFGYRGLVGTSAAMRRIYSLIDRVRETDVPVLITGESGTGKEVVARAIHDASLRSKAKMLGVNCGAIPENLLESELFGHVKGAYTGADRDRRGLFRECEGGTILLDEIGETPHKMQAGLLRVLQERRVRAVGGATEEPVDVRVLFATNRDLSQLVTEGKFREDLYYRIQVVEIRLPALRERAEDIPQLVDHFLGIFAARYKREKKTIDKEALQRLTRFAWPGNVRQLENVLLNAWVLTDAPEIEASDLDLPDGWAPAQPARSEQTHPHAIRPARAQRKGTISEHRRDERDRILQALRDSNWNRVKAAEISGIPRRTFYRRLREYGIQ